MKIKICKDITINLESFNVSGYTFSLLEQNNTANLSDEISNLFFDIAKKYQETIDLKDVTKLEKLKFTRDGYKKLGKDPSHTRPACESLIRRIIKNGSIYRLGNAIDLGNYISILTMKSVCMVDLDKLDGDVLIRVGKNTDIYEGINRGLINVTNIPLYCDNISPFGNPTSDTIRTSITNNTKNILIMLIHFDNFLEDELIMVELLNKYLKIKNLQKIEVIKD